MAKVIMIQGTGSNVGKSMIVAGLCRALYNRGFSVAPFKPQNMSNNAAVTADGGEIGRAQALQARACHIAPMVDMNPVLLKPENEIGCQVVVRGKRLKTVKAKEYAKLKPQLLQPVLESFHALCQKYDYVIVEGAGSPAEVNLRQGDIANMGFAQAADVPVILLGDIDRGGVIAQIIGTKAVINKEDAELIKGFAINKFRGDPRLFDDGYRLIEAHSGWAGLGVIPYFSQAWRLPPEDVLDLPSNDQNGDVHIAALRFKRIANFDDFDPLRQEPGVRFTLVEPGSAIPGDANVVILPGSKSTLDDLDDLRVQGWDIDLQAHHRRGGYILGICGGFQMLGQEILDPLKIESKKTSIKGLGFLDVTTKMQANKTLTRLNAVHCESGAEISGYEIHKGETISTSKVKPFAKIQNRLDGAIDKSGRVFGSYIHGLFTNESFRREFLASFNLKNLDFSYEATVEETLDNLAEHLELHLDIDFIRKSCTTK